MNCENCFYQKLCERAGVSFKAEADGVTCARLKNYPESDDVCLTPSQSHTGVLKGVRGVLINTLYDDANRNDTDAQEKPRPNMASLMTREQNKKARDRDFYAKNAHKKQTQQ